MTTAESLFVAIAGENPVMQAFVGGLVIAGMNLIGAALVFVWRNPAERSLDTALGFAAGVMLAASFTSLIIPGIDFASEAAYNPVTLGGVELVGIVPVLIGLVAGTLFLDRADALVPHAHYLVTGRQRADAAKPDDREEALFPDPDARMAAVVLFVLAITLHNMPEGLAVGVGFGSGDLGGAIALMVAIGLQNIPEGLAVSIAALNAGLDSRWYAAVAGLRAGVVEIPLAVFGAFAVQIASPLLPYAMGFAAGAMLFVISDEIIPETHTHGNERVATLGTMAGIIVMLTLDVVLA
ncbi:MAG: ZIP family metal transporter [Natronomonas sp.]